MKNKTTKIAIIVSAIVVGVVATAFIISSLSNNSAGDEPTNVVSGETANENSSEKKLEIKEQGWSYVKSSWGGYISYGVAVYNPNGEYLAGFPKVKCTGKDADGKILFSYDENIDYIYPKETVFVGSTFNVDEKPATIELSIEMSKKDWESARSVNYPKNNSQIVSNISEKKDDEMRIYNGEVENTSDTDLDNDILTVIFREDGKIVGANNTYSDDLDAGQRSIFTIYANNVPDYDKYEISARIGSIN